MNILQQLTKLFTAQGGEGNIHREYVRCFRCKETLVVRVNLDNELTPQYGEGEGEFYVRKGILGSGKNRCFQTVEVELYFNLEKQLISRNISGGEFITQEEFKAETRV